jgi:hypothetical protein
MLAAQRLRQLLRRTMFLRALPDFTDRRLVKGGPATVLLVVERQHRLAGDVASGKSHGRVEIEMCTGVGYRNLSSRVWAMAGDDNL